MNERTAGRIAEVKAFFEKELGCPVEVDGGSYRNYDLEYTYDPDTGEISIDIYTPAMIIRPQEFWFHAHETVRALKAQIAEHEVAEKGAHER